jgi:hypothetical protein
MMSVVMRIGFAVARDGVIVRDTAHRVLLSALVSFPLGANPPSSESGRIPGSRGRQALSDRRSLRILLSDIGVICAPP